MELNVRNVSPNLNPYKSTKRISKQQHQAGERTQNNTEKSSIKNAIQGDIIASPDSRD